MWENGHERYREIIFCLSSQVAFILAATISILSEEISLAV